MNSTTSRKILIAAVLATASASSHAFECEDGFGVNAENAWFHASNVAMLADYSTTLTIPRDKRPNGTNRFVEVAPGTKKIIGSHPTQRRIHQFFGARLLLNAAIQCLAPHGSVYKQIFFQAETAVHTYAALNNYRIGIRFSDGASIIAGIGGYVGVSYALKF